MRVKVLSRNPDEYTRETKKDIHKVQRNYDPNLHPFETPREYTRALNATKLERVFAKPFIGSLEGHRDGVQCMQKHSKSLSHCLSGSCDGQVKIWNLARKKCEATLNAHEGMVRGLAFHPEGRSFFSCGSDKVIKQWNAETCSDEPLSTIIGKTVYQSMDHHWSDPVFATCGEQVDIWEEERAEPMRTFTWGVDSTHHIKFNPVEHNILATCASDRSIILYDLRGSTPIRKVVLTMMSNAVSWNPLEAVNFTVANEDYNLYTFDMRKMDQPSMAYMDHVGAVLDVDYSPTGKEFVTGSYDKTVRIFNVRKGQSRDVYHTKRMQRVQCVQWSGDSKYLLSASDEMNIRLWKANASEKLGVLRPREREAKQYNDALKRKFSQHPQVRRISRHRHVPRSIIVAKREIAEQRASHRRKEVNRMEHAPGKFTRKGHRQKAVVSQQQ